MKTETIILKKDSNVTLTCYLHETSTEMPNVKTRPAMLIFPGGGYRMCSDREAEPVALSFMAEGYQAFVLRYTVGGSVFNDAFADAENALALIREKAEEWHVDTQKIAVIGFSAGGHLAAILGTSGRVRPAAQILCYPAILEINARSGLPFPIPGADKAVTGKTPPTFIFATSEDELSLTEHSLRFALALNAANVPYELHIFQKGRHGLSLAKPLTSGGVKSMGEKRAAEWFCLSVDWLSDIFGDFPTEAESQMQKALHEYTEYSADVVLRELWKNSACQKLLLEKIPALEDEKTREIAMPVSLRVMAEYAKEMIPLELLTELNSTLKTIPVGSQ
jgi:acetyl esterase/lipase